MKTFMKKAIGIGILLLLLASNIEGRGGGRGGGGGGRGGSRGSSSGSRSSSSSGSRTSTSTSSSAGWRSPSRSTSSTSSYGWRSSTSPSTSTSSSYGWRSPSTSTPSYGWRTPSTSTTGTGSSTSSYGWRTPSTSTGTRLNPPITNPRTSTLFGSSGTSTSPAINTFVYGGGRHGGSRGNTALRLGALAGAARFRTHTRYRGVGFSFESNSIEDMGIPWRTISLTDSVSGTCSGLITNRNSTRPATVAAVVNNSTGGESTNSTQITPAVVSDSVNVTIYQHAEFKGRTEVVELSPRQCVNVHLMDPSWNDEASSIKPGTACVIIWQHKDCTGRFACFREGSRGSNNFALIGMNDDLTSMQLC